MIPIKVQTYLNSLLYDILELDLSNCNLTELPDLSRFTQLQELNCEQNKLTSLPDHLPHYLRRLYCSCNQLTSLPTTYLFI